MECNKDEAVRARQIAESRMQRGDFVEALKFAMKAKKLYPDVDSIAQMITVCEVHSAARNKISGSEMDWYGILQAEQLADVATIKKQYRKLALLLHPDKNQFAGAEAAFKLIGEANMMLSDQAKRSLYDMKYRVSVRAAAPKPSPHHSSGNTFAAKHNGNASNFQSYSCSTSQNAHQQDEQQTFWTFCRHCNAKYQYHKSYKNVTLRCQKCSKFFIAYDMGCEGASSGGHVPMKKCATPVHVKRFAASVPVKRCATPVPSEHRKGEQIKDGYVAAGTAKGNVKTSKPAASKAKEAQTSTNVGSKRVMQSAPGSRESCKNENDNFMKDASVRENSVTSAGLNLRRSSRQKQHVSYTVTPQDDHFESPSKKPRNESLNFSEVEKQKVPASSGLSHNNIPASSHPEIIHFPDTDFYDFEKDKAEDCFAVNQLWAIYDPTDAMPRFYALVRKMVSPFKLLITWLEPAPDDQGEIDWHVAGLPVACGKFKLGLSQRTTDRNMFSHQMRCMEGSVRGSYLVYPKKGETWAIFRDWDIKWSSNSKKHSKYEYEYVEVLSDFAENSGIEVAYLGKVKGFDSLFQKIEKNGFSSSCVPSNELYRFSHRIPSYKLIGNEREGVPRESFELDSAALPIHL